LPPRAHSIYYRDEIGNISTSNVWGDPKKVDILIDAKQIIGIIALVCNSSFLLNCRQNC
jgi:hypothetical protein